MKSAVVIEVICEAWRKKQPELLGDILGKDFQWFEDPFDSKPCSDADELIHNWHTDIAEQENITVDFEILSEYGNRIVAHWWAAYDTKGVPHELDGVFYVWIDSEGKLKQFRQWWVKR